MSTITNRIKLFAVAAVISIASVSAVPAFARDRDDRRCRDGVREHRAYFHDRRAAVRKYRPNEHYHYRAEHARYFRDRRPAYYNWWRN